MYLENHLPQVAQALGEHLVITGITMAISFLLASAIVLLTYNHRGTNRAISYVLALLYTVPSLGFFALLIPLTGIGKTTAIIVLVLYALYVQVRNFSTALHQVDKDILDAALGMGMTQRQILRQVQIPLALPGIFTGIKISATATIAMATIAAAINAGGLGVILFDGFRTFSLDKILTATGFTVALALAVLWVLKLAERLFCSHCNRN